MQKILKSTKGSMIVEASLVMPVVFVCVFAVIYIAMLLYQQVYVQSVADKAVERGGNYQGEDEAKTKSARDYALSALEKQNVLTSVDKAVDVKLKNSIIHNTLAVTVEDTYKIPISGLLRLAGMQEGYRISVQSDMAINDPAEFIRTTDFMLDLEKELEKKNPGIKDLGEKTRETMRKIKDSITK